MSGAIVESDALPLKTVESNGAVSNASVMWTIIGICILMEASVDCICVWRPSRMDWTSAVDARFAGKASANAAKATMTTKNDAMRVERCIAVSVGVG